MKQEEIIKESPECPGYGGGQWAMYSVGCTWWTSFPKDLGNTKERGGYPVGLVIENRDGSKHTIGDDHPGLPCCPHCGSVLMQAPLEDFISNAVGQPENYGVGGFDTFIEAHSRNSNRCYRSWDELSIGDFNPPTPRIL